MERKISHLECFFRLYKKPHAGKNLFWISYFICNEIHVDSAIQIELCRPFGAFHLINNLCQRKYHYLFCFFTYYFTSYLSPFFFRPFFESFSSRFRDRRLIDCKKTQRRQEETRSGQRADWYWESDWGEKWVNLIVRFGVPISLKRLANFRNKLTVFSIFWLFRQKAVPLPAILRNFAYERTTTHPPWRHWIPCV